MATRTSTAGTREIEGRDSVGLYLDEIARNPLLDAQTEVELSKTIEAGLMAEHLLATDRVGRKKGGAPGYANREERPWDRAAASLPAWPSRTSARPLKSATRKETAEAPSASVRRSASTSAAATGDAFSTASSRPAKFKCASRSSALAAA